MSTTAFALQLAPAPETVGDRFNTRLVPNRHGDSSGVRGAAWL